MHNTNSKIRMTDFIFMRDFLQDVKAALQNPSVSKFTSLQVFFCKFSHDLDVENKIFVLLKDVQLSCDQNMNTIKLSLRGISLTLQRCTETPWKVVSSDIPVIPEFEGFEKNVTNLSVAMTKFKWQVEILEKAWEQLKEIDE